MKIMKIFGVVMALHAFVLVVIFANPGCSSSRQVNGPRPVPSDSVSDTAAPLVVPASPRTSSSISTIAAVAFDPNAPAVPEGASRATPRRPDTVAPIVNRPAPAPAPAPTKTYTVANGDSLWKIAQANSITYQELAAANGLSSDAALKVGQKLVIPTKPGAQAPASQTAGAGTPGLPAGGSAAAGSRATGSAASTKTGASATTAAPASTKSGPAGFEYTVLVGDSLSSIAQKFQVKVGDLAAENNLPNPNLVRAGMKLIIPGWQAPPSSTKAGGTPGGTGSPAGGSAAAGSRPSGSTVETIGAAKSTSEIPVIKLEEVPVGKR